MINPFRYYFRRPSPTFSPSAPSVAATALQVRRSICRLARSLPAPRPCSHSPGFEHLDRSGHLISLPHVGADLLLGGTEVNASLRNVRASTAPLPCPHPSHASERSDALSHASDEAFSLCVPPATVRLLDSRRVAAGRCLCPTASIGPWFSHQAGCFGPHGRPHGQKAMRYDARGALHVRRSSRIRPYAPCLRGRASVSQRRRARFPGRWQLPRHGGYAYCWSELARRPCALAVSDAVRAFIGPSILGTYVTDVRGFSGRGDSFTEHKIHVCMVLMIVLKYLGGAVFFSKAQISRCEHVRSP